MVCFVLFICGLVVIELERIMFSVNVCLWDLLNSLDLFNESIVICMIGCFNGCVWFYMVEIGFVGSVFNSY